MSKTSKVIFWTLLGTIGTVTATHYLAEPFVKWLDNLFNSLPNKTFNTPTIDNSAVNTIAEGNRATVKNYIDKPVFTTIETQVYFNPFVENAPLIGRQLPANTAAGILTGQFARFKGIFYAQIANNNELGWANIGCLKPV